jgi:hypothetical protein
MEEESIKRLPSEKEWMEERLEAIKAAIADHTAQNKPFYDGWVYEYNRIVKYLYEPSPFAPVYSYKLCPDITEPTATDSMPAPSDNESTKKKGLFFY